MQTLLLFSKTVLSFNTYSIFTLLTSEEKKFNINVNLLECPLIVYVLFKKKKILSFAFEMAIYD